MSCLLAYVLPLLGPCLCLLYFGIVYGLYVSMHEFTLSSRLVPLSIRVGLVVGASAISVGLCEAGADDDAIIPVGVILMAISIYLCMQTRVHDVVGSIDVTWHDDHLAGKTVLVTGANTGIGKETAKQLASMGATVIMACRSQAKAQSAMDDIRRTSRNHIEEDRLIFLQIDLGDFSSIRSAVEVVEGMQIPCLDALVNNAGVMMGTKTQSKDGNEMMMQANHLGHFLLTTSLIPLLQKAKGGCRIVNVTSSTHKLVKGGFDFDDMFCDFDRQYSLFGQYAMSKLANILFTKELARRYRSTGDGTTGIAAFAIHPGIVRTDVTRNMQWFMRLPNQIFGVFVSAVQKTPAEGAYCSVYCIAAAQPPPTGSYIVNCREEPSSEASMSVEDSKRLWNISAKLVSAINAAKK